MTPDTPLTDVVKHLSADIARLLCDVPPPVQESVLKAVRDAYVYLEKAGTTFNPVQEEAAIGILVATLTPWVQAREELRAENEVLQTLVVAADTIFKGLAQSGGSDG